MRDERGRFLAGTHPFPKGEFKMGHKINLGKKRPDVTERNKELNTGKSLSEETRRKIGEARKGSKNNFWKGGITTEMNRIRKSLEYRIWRQKVFQRDKFICVFCGYKSKGKHPSDIQADHIKPFKSFPELHFSVDNGRTLCLPCHQKTETWGQKVI